MTDTQTHCYCGNVDLANREGTFQCSECKKRFHKECLKNPVVTPLAADAFYNFTCGQCAPDGVEQYSRAKMSWQDAIVLTMYNLQLGGGGKRGYFRWKDHICAFIDKYFGLLFGQHRKRKQAWHGTVAGAVSAGCPRHFVSGTAELGEPGWWKLAVMKPPIYEADPPVKKTQRRTKQTSDQEIVAQVKEEEGGPCSKRARRSKPFSMSAAIELKAKRSTITDTPGRRCVTMASMAKTLAKAGPSETTTSQQDLDMEADYTNTSGSSQTIDASSLYGSSQASTPKRYIASTSGMSVPQAALPSGPLQLVPAQRTKHTGTESFPVPQAFRVVQHVSQQSSLDVSPSLSSHSAPQSFSPEHKHVAVKEEVCDFPEDVSAEGGLQASSTDNVLLDPIDIDYDCLDSFNENLSADTMEMPFEPARSPDMVDLVMSMPVSGETESPPQFSSSSLQDMAQPPESHTQSCEDTNQLTDIGKHPPSNPVSEDPAMDSEGPSEGEEEFGGRSEEEEEGEEEEEEEEEREAEKDASVTVLSAPARMQKYRRKTPRREEVTKEPEEEEDSSSNLRYMTPYDEKVMLERLESIMDVQPRSKDGKPLEPWEADRLCKQRNMLRRKLLVRKLQRENGVPVFDLDAVMERLNEKYHGIKPKKKEEEKVQRKASSHPHSFSSRTLDRFMRKASGVSVEVKHVSFQTRLVGFEDHQLEPITSPYTMRVLKPFIWRDNETKPLKVKLLQEIISYPHRNDPTWTPPPPASLDYCYVRPQHIPSVNALCRDHFWPGIDLSESLQYPDFSCVALYRKLVIGFAFLVPDVKHNEAYISFLFTRPDWRGAGIATFMLYHLCQTCMGKDITLHVSATNPAMLLYQKFGFKAEELCLDFYDKYFPPDSKECKHAFFMRMR